MKRITFFLSAILLAVNIIAAETLGFEGESHAQVGVFIQEIKSGKVIADINSQKVLCPASITKSLTSATALSLLGANHQFTTNVVAMGIIDSSGVLHGDIVVKACGDPTLESDHFKNNLGFCKKVVEGAQRLGIKKVEGTIRVSGSMPGEGPVLQWEVEDLGYTYGAGIFALNWRDNVFNLNVATGATSPKVPGIKVKPTRTTSGGTDVVRGVYSSDIYVYSQSVGNKNFTVGTTMPHPAEAMIEELRSELTKAGISCGTRSMAKGNGERTIYTHKSPKLTEILRSLMFRSDNMMAEGMLRALAPGQSAKTCINKEITLWNGRGVSMKYTSVFDGSGLTRATRLSPAFMGAMLRYMANSQLADTYCSCFPRVGKDGTVKGLFVGTRLKGKLALKSGSMNGVQSYAGYLMDANNKPTHVVVFMVNGFYCPRADLRKAIEKFALSHL